MTVKITDEESDELHQLYTRYNSYAALIFENNAQYLDKYIQSYVSYQVMQSSTCRKYNMQKVTSINFNESEMNTLGVPEKRTYLDLPTGNMETINARCLAVEFLISEYKESDKISLDILIDRLGIERTEFEKEYLRLNASNVYYDGVSNKFFTKE